MRFEVSVREAVNASLLPSRTQCLLDVASLSLDVCHQRSCPREGHACPSCKLGAIVKESQTLDCLTGVANFHGHVTSRPFSTSVGSHGLSGYHYSRISSSSACSPSNSPWAAPPLAATSSLSFLLFAGSRLSRRISTAASAARASASALL